MSGSGISWAVCKSAPRSRQITTPAPHRSVFYRPDVLPAAQPTASKHWSTTDPLLKVKLAVCKAATSPVVVWCVCRCATLRWRRTWQHWWSVVRPPATLCLRSPGPSSTLRRTMDFPQSTISTGGSPSPASEWGPRKAAKNYNKWHDKSIFFSRAISIMLISNHNSFRMLFSIIASIYFIWKIV